MRRDRLPAPVTLLTGFLGSGKTTILNAILADPAMRGTAVVVNEFGSISIDHDLVHAGREDYVVTSTGCICCTAGSDIRASLHEVADAADRGTFPPFDRVIVETTGLADPAPIINSLIPGGAPAVGLRDHVLARRFRLAGVVTTFDAVMGEAALDCHLVCWKQLAFADRIVLTKTDLIRDPDARSHLPSLQQRLRSLNPSAEILLREDLPRSAGLVGERSYVVGDKPEDVIDWLALERAMEGAGHAHAHDPDRHGDTIQAVPFVETEPLDPGYFDAFVDLMMLQSGVLRLKGLVALSDDPERPMLVHGVQHVVHEKRRLERWPSADRRSRIVVLSDGISPEATRRLFAATARRPLRSDEAARPSRRAARNQCAGRRGPHQGLGTRLPLAAARCRPLGDRAGLQRGRLSAPRDGYPGHAPGRAPEEILRAQGDPRRRGIGHRHLRRAGLCDVITLRMEIDR